jgi:ring-1,2-phenylacetyl-CoA epoxidase subunit PaaC
VNEATVSLDVRDMPVVRYVLGLGDDALVLAQRLCEWATLAPAIEEDVALMNIALDLLGQARSLLSYAGELEGAGRSEDDLAFLRQEREFRNCQLVELENGDFARTMARQLLFSTYQCGLYGALSRSSDDHLAAVAAKATKEVTYHREHASSWVVRLGDGTEESHVRMVAGLEAVWPFAGEMFESPDLGDLLATGLACDAASLEPAWRASVSQVLSEATLEVPATTWAPTGGRSGLHTEGFGYLLAEMQHLHRSHPGATW